jgi:hypothetical protein
MGGRLPPESVAGINRNGWPASSGIGGRNRAEYAAIIKKQMKLDLSLYKILQIFSITLFEKMPILQALTETDYKNKITSGHIQLNLFES